MNVTEEKIRVHIISSSIAACIAEVVTLPICTIKTNHQNTENKKITTVVHEIWKTRGIRGFYNASLWAMFSQTLSTTTKYTLYNQLKPMIEKDNVDPISQITRRAIAGATSGALSSLLTHPFDVLKIHSQMNKPFSVAFKETGFKIFYRGYSKTFSKSVIGSIFFYPIYDTSKEIINNNVKIENDILKNILASLLSATISTTLMQPLDYMKTRHIYGNTYKHSLYRIDGYFKGLSLNLFRIIPHFTITMTSIEFIKKNISTSR